MKMKRLAAAMPCTMRYSCFCGLYRAVMFVMEMLIMMFVIVRVVGCGGRTATIVIMRGSENALVIACESISPWTATMVAALCIRCD
ncbi:hypothetical protein [Maridesulfovibrio salexigens]|uniref:hypothetical protein n=1 Tax=Maridesulfovibrio salexigens TaxID=880 RepID=UPI0005A2AAE3|nr:hypothetical protein [Maridesulfovibrio salexigens]